MVLHWFAPGMILISSAPSLVTTFRRCSGQIQSRSGLPWTLEIPCPVKVVDYVQLHMKYCATMRIICVWEFVGQRHMSKRRQWACSSGTHLVALAKKREEWWSSWWHSLVRQEIVFQISARQDMAIFSRSWNQMMEKGTKQLTKMRNLHDPRFRAVGFDIETT